MLQNVHRIEGPLAYVALTQEQWAIIDASELPKVLQHRWFATRNKMGGFYAATSGPVYMHRFILDAPKGKEVDHANHNTLDNRRENLVISTHQENLENREGANTNSKTGVRGVQAHKCKPSGMMYSFRCQCRSCPAYVFFPYTEEGLAQAIQYATEHHEARRSR